MRYEALAKPKRSHSSENDRLLRFRCSLSLRRFGKGSRIIRETVEVGDDIRPLASSRYSGKGHIRAGHRSFRICNELVDIVDGPIAALRFERSGVVKPWLWTFGATHNTPQAWSD